MNEPMITHTPGLERQVRHFACPAGDATAPQRAQTGERPGLPHRAATALAPSLTGN